MFYFVPSFLGLENSCRSNASA